MSAPPMPLTETQLAVAELNDVVPRGLSPEEMAERGWTAMAGLMRHRRELIAEAEGEAA